MGPAFATPARSAARPAASRVLSSVLGNDGRGGAQREDMAVRARQCDAGDEQMRRFAARLRRALCAVGHQQQRVPFETGLGAWECALQHYSSTIVTVATAR